MRVMGKDIMSLALREPLLSDGDLVLRPWESSDTEVVLAAGRDPVVARFRYSLPGSGAGAREWLAAVASERVAGERLELAITEGGIAVGSVSLTDFEHGNAMVRYWLLPGGRGRGLATRAVRLLVGWAFSELRIGRVAAFIEVDNGASQRVLERCGFVREGLLRKHMEGRDGHRVDSLIYGLLPDDLESRGALVS
jgi:RimJ/RimL family protein N-acetyltransferase